MRLRVVIDLFGLGLGDIAREYTDHSTALRVHRQHELCRLLATKAEEDFQDMYHKLHWRVIIVQ